MIDAYNYFIIPLRKWSYSFRVCYYIYYMRPEMISTRNGISAHSIINFACITFHCVWNEMKFFFGSGPRKTAHSVKANHSYFDEINVCADAYFRVILFQLVFTWHFITRNEILFLSKWPQCISFWVVFSLWFCKYKLWFLGLSSWI